MKLSKERLTEMREKLSCRRIGYPNLFKDVEDLLEAVEKLRDALKCYGYGAGDNGREARIVLLEVFSESEGA